MQNQKNATVAVIMSVLAENGIDYKLNGETTVSEVLTDTMKTSVRDTLFQMFRDEEVTVSDAFREAKLHNDSELKKYISGLTNNWIRKYKGFNRGEAYVAKNPGSRQFSGDAQLKALKGLASQQAGNDEALAEINEAIDARKAQIASEKAKDIEIDASALPEHLRGLISN